MGKQLLQWFVYCVVVGLFAAYVTGQALGPGAEYMQVFRLASTTAFMGYALAHAQDAIWMGQGWAATAPEHGRRADLRAAYRRHLRVALAMSAPLTRLTEDSKATDVR